MCATLAVSYGKRVMASNANIVNFGVFSWILLRFCNVCNSATDFFSISHASCRCSARKCCSISVCATFLAEQVRCTFVLMLLQK